MAAKSGKADFDGYMIATPPLPGEPDVDEILASAMIGPAEHCAEMLLRDVEVLSPSHISCFMHFGGLEEEQVQRSMSLFMKDVAPVVRGAAAAREAA